MKQQSDATVQNSKQPYQAPVLTKHQRLQKVTLGTVTPQFSGESWLQPGQ